MAHFFSRTFFIACILLPGLLWGQRKQVLFQTKSYQTCDSAQASFRVELWFADSTQKACRLKRFWLDGQCMEEISYSDYEKKVKEGPEKEYHTNGQLKLSANWKKGVWHDSLRTFYPNGAKKRSDWYQNGEWVSGKCYGKSGADTTWFALEIEPVFPGSLGEFVGTNTRYPRKARRNSIEGRILVSFLVNRQGKVTEVKSENPSNDLLAAEAERVVKLMPDWKPGSFDGEPVNVRMRIPIVFRLTREEENSPKRWTD